MGNVNCRAAALIVRDGQILMAKNCGYPGYYTVGGGIEADESSVQTLARELREELGRALEIGRLVFVEERFHGAVPGKRHQITFYYSVALPDDFEIKEHAQTDQGDFETLHWLPIERLGEYEVIPAYLKTKLRAVGDGIEHIIFNE